MCSKADVLLVCAASAHGQRVVYALQTEPAAVPLRCIILAAILSRAIVSVRGQRSKRRDSFIGVLGYRVLKVRKFEGSITITQELPIYYIIVKVFLLSRRRGLCGAPLRCCAY